GFPGFVAHSAAAGERCRSASAGFRMAMRNPGGELAMNKLAVGLILSATFACAIAVTEPAAARAPIKEDNERKGQPLDLSGFYHTTTAKLDMSERYPWRIVPRGSRTFGNVPVEIGGAMFLWGESSAKQGQVFKEKVDDITVKRHIDTLYVYHATFF